MAKPQTLNQVKHDEEMIRSVWDWAGEMHALYGVGVRVTLAPTKRPGILLLKAQALEMADGKPIGVRVQYTIEWPTSTHQTLAGAVLGAAMHLDHLLGMDMLAQGTGNPE